MRLRVLSPHKHIHLQSYKNTNMKFTLLSWLPVGQGWRREGCHCSWTEGSVCDCTWYHCRRQVHGTHILI